MFVFWWFQTRSHMFPCLTLSRVVVPSYLCPKPTRRQHASALRDLAARAQGEITLREAVGELRAWCDQAEFKCTRERFGSKQVRRMCRVCPDASWGYLHLPCSRLGRIPAWLDS